MKTPDKIKKGLRWCGGIMQVIEGCQGCPYYMPEDNSCVQEDMHADALDYINQFESTYSQVSKALCGKENATQDELLLAADQLKSRLAQVERERDAAVQIVHGLCLHCKNEHSEGETCRACLYYPYRYVYGTGDKYIDNWEWRGPENTKEEAQDE